jgi:signal transduction histidine kinase
LRQILLNLVGNAIKFTQDRRVELIARMAKAGDFEGPRICFDVRDTGVGLSEEQIGRLFEPFCQVETTAHRFVGTGLGLTISKRLARLLGGDITVKSQLGAGSTFTLTIETGLSGGASIGGVEDASQAPPASRSASDPDLGSRLIKNVAPACR